MRRDEGQERASEGDVRLRAISSLTTASLGHLDVDDLLAELLVRISELLRTDTAAVLLLDKSGRQLVARAAYGIEEEVRQGVRVTVGRGFSGKIAAERRPITLDRIDESTVENPLLWEHGISHMLGVPLQTGTGLVGVLHVGRIDDGGFSAEETELLEVAADRVVGAIQARELEVERAAARVLQRSLLPSALPEVPGIDFATRYVPAQEGGVGGDWYDAFLLPSDELWIMVGDVAGHGLSSGVIMGRLRATLRSYALIGERPEAVLARADRKLQFFEPGQMATVLCGRLRPPYDAVLLATAGHLPPVLARPDRPTSIVDLPVAPPLGAVADLVPQAVDVPLPPGSVLVAYTDGLVERRGELLDRGLERLVEATRAVLPELVCREVMDALVGLSVPRDDIAVLALRRSTSE